MKESSGQNGTRTLSRCVMCVRTCKHITCVQNFPEHIFSFLPVLHAISLQKMNTSLVIMYCVLFPLNMSCVFVKCLQCTCILSYGHPNFQGKFSFLEDFD